MERSTVFICVKKIRENHFFRRPKPGSHLKSGLGGDHGMGPPRLIHLLLKYRVESSRPIIVQSGGASPCMSHISLRACTGTSWKQLGSSIVKNSKYTYHAC